MHARNRIGDRVWWLCGLAFVGLTGCGNDSGSACGPGRDDLREFPEVQVDVPPTCLIDADCPADGDSDPSNDPACVGGLCLVPCRNVSDCGPVEHCDVDLPPLIDLCESDGDCDQAGWICPDGVCRLPCDPEGECPGRQLCEQNVCLSGYCLLHTWEGELGVEERRVVGTDAEHDTLVQAHFRDFTFYAVEKADREMWPDYPACWVYTSRPVSSGEPIPLEVERVTFSGLAGGDLDLEPDGPGHLPTETLSGRGFVAERVTVVVRSGGGEDDFPAFEQQVAAPAQPTLVRLGDFEPVDLADGLAIGIERMEPLLVEWKPAGSDIVEILLIPGSGSQTPWIKLRCITYDDGCLEIPAAALTRLALDQATNFHFRIGHHNYVQHEIRQSGQLKALVRIDASSVLEGIVAR